MVVRVSSLLLRNIDVVTLNAQGDVLRGVDIAIEGGNIVAVGTSPAEFSPTETLDGSHLLALPGFWNAHTHAAMTLERSYADDLPIDRWFNERIWRIEGGLTEEDVVWGTSLALAEMIRSGTVGFADHYFWMHRVAELVDQSGMKALLAQCIFDDPTLDGSVEFARTFRAAAQGRIRTVLGPHSPYTCSVEMLARVGEIARQEGLGVHLHLAETAAQVERSLSAHGKTPTALVADLGLFDVPGARLAAHGIAVSPADMALLTQHQVTVAQCTGCTMKHALGTPLAVELMNQGVAVALGTDGPASNNDLDMLQEAQLTALFHKARLGDATVLGGDQVLRMATQVGARAMGFARSGVIEPGAPADLILFDVDVPHMRPRHNLVGNLVYAAKSSDVRHAIIDGRFVMKDRALLTLDEEKILWEAERRADALAARVSTSARQYPG
jgi:5-methylthioadenosine/S-adenosylhomocysteine deaminase